MQKLYNEQQKQGFLDSLPDYKNSRTKKNYENLMLSISKYEEQLDKDFCEMNIPEVKVVISSMGILSTGSLNTIIAILRDYSNWCICNGKTTYENALNKISYKDFDITFNIKCKMLKSPDHLHQILSNAFGTNFSNLNGYAFQSQLIAWLLYFGFSKEQVMNIKKQDIKTKENLRKFKNDYDFGAQEDLIFNLLDLCSKLETIVTSSPLKGVVRENLVESVYVLRGKQNVRAKEMMALALLSSRVSEINKKYSENTKQLLDLTIDRISLSGKFHKLYLLEQSEIKITKEIICEIFSINYESKLTITNEASKKLYDYSNWKKAFEL